MLIKKTSLHANVEKPLLLDLIPYLVDEKLGLINHLSEVPVRAGSPSFFHYRAIGSNSQLLGGAENFSFGGGASANPQIAQAKAIGEVVERYCSAFSDQESEPCCSFLEASFPCINPKLFAFYADEQYREAGFPWSRFTEHTPARWTNALCLGSAREVWIPSALVYLPYSFKRNVEAPIVQPMSTGLACGASLHDAYLSAVCEVIERDAFTLTWQGMMNPPRLQIPTGDSEIDDLIDRFAGVGRLDLYDLTLDQPFPTVLATLRTSEIVRPALSAAAATRPVGRVAVIKALEELAHTYRYMAVIKHSHPSPPTTVRDKISHLSFWASHKNLELSDFLLEGGRWTELEAVKSYEGSAVEALEYCVQELTGCGYDLLVKELTTCDIEEVGLNVVRAIIPGYHPLFMGHHLRSLGGKRLWEVPQRFGYRGVTKPHDNQVPHPYP